MHKCRKILRKLKTSKCSNCCVELALNAPEMLPADVKGYCVSLVILTSLLSGAAHFHKSG
jgi:hypothetical protein